MSRRARSRPDPWAQTISLAKTQAESELENSDWTPDPGSDDAEETAQHVGALKGGTNDD